ncbi:hypothetical protein WJX79_001751 [Trebouxia sp. C0005]
MPRASKSKPLSAALDLKSTYMATVDEVLGSGATMREGHVSENSDTSPVSVDASAYSRGFGTSDGLCSCARCLRKSAPFTSDYREAVNDVARCLARLDPDYRAAVAEEFIKGTTTIQTSAADNERQELAEAICQAAIEQADPVQLGELLSNQVVDNVTAAEIADILALLAAQRGHASIIPILADNGAQFDRPDFHRGGPPLMHAVNNGHASTVAALLEANADIDDMDNAGQTALMVAVFSDRAQAAEVLIKHGKADLEAEDDIGRTAVSHAAKYGSVDCLNLLGNAHADVFHKDREGKTPLQIAEASSRSEAVLALKKWQSLQTMRMRCEKKRQKDATQQQAELTAEQIAERKAKADAFAEALLAEDAAEKERGQSQKLKAKKAKAKGKGKTASALAPVGDNLPAAADAAPKGLSSSRGAALRGGSASREERRDYDEDPPQQAPKSYPAGVRHVPAHPAPRAAALEHHNGRPIYTGGSGSEYDHSPGPDSDYGAGSEDYDYVPTRSGRGAARGRGAAVRGRGGRGPPAQERGGRGQAARPQPELAAADPRAFIPGLAMAAAPQLPPDRANPDPLAFGTVVAGPKQQLNALLLQLPAMKEDPEQELGLQFLLREIRKVQSSAAKQGSSLPVEADMAARELTATLGARAQLQAAISARPVNALALQLACEAGRECKLLHRGLLMAADSKLRNIRAKTNPEAAAYFTAPRQQSEARPYDPRQQHPDARQHPDGRTQRGELRPPRGEPKRGPEARTRSDSRQHGDPRQQHPEARPHAEPRQQQYVPEQPHPQYEPHRQHAPQTEARNGRQAPQEFAEVPEVREIIQLFRT